MLNSHSYATAGLRGNRLFQAAAMALILALATLASAWGFERLGGYIPCELCLKQRWAYYAAIPLAALLLWPASRNQTTIARLGLGLLAIIMAANAIIGAYQAGSEWGLWSLSAACESGGGLSGGLPDLENARVIRCDEAQWRFLGLSFAGWNAVISGGLAVLCLWGMSAAQGSSSVSQ